MIITILYSLWIAYTVVSLSAILGVVGLGYWASWSNAKHMENVRKMMTEDPDPLPSEQQPEKNIF
jgi:hypothetical protein